MRTISAAQQAILDGASPGGIVLLMQLDHPDGTIRMSTLSGAEPWVDADGYAWTAGGHVLSFGPTFSRMGVEGGALTVQWNGASAALIASARDGKIAGASFKRQIAFIDENADQVGDKITDFVGICETPEIDANPESPSIALTVESRVLRLARTRTFRYTPESQGRYWPDDTGFDFVSGLQDVDPFKEG